MIDSHGKHRRIATTKISIVHRHCNSQHQKRYCTQAVAEYKAMCSVPLQQMDFKHFNAWAWYTEHRQRLVLPLSLNSFRKSVSKLAEQGIRAQQNHRIVDTQLPFRLKQGSKKNVSLLSAPPSKQACGSGPTCKPQTRQLPPHMLV